MSDWGRGMAAIQNAMAQAAAHEQERQFSEALRQQREYMIEILSVTFDKGAAYTNIIIIGGYAGVFALWSYTHDKLPIHSSIWVAACIGISLISFISFEIYKMADGVHRGLQQRAILVKSLQPAEFVRRLEALRIEQNLNGIRWMIPIWIVQLCISIGFALAALGILFWNFFWILTH